MPRKKEMGRAANGLGTIRKKVVKKNGQEYTYWEARVTTGRDPGTGKQIQRSFTGKTQKEVREKMQAAAVEINQGTYTAPSKMTVGQWLDVWAAEYLGGVKPMTVLNYSQHIKNHIKPAMGAIITSAIRRSELIASEYSKKRNPPRLLMALIMLMCIFLAWTFTTGVFPFGA